MKTHKSSLGLFFVAVLACLLSVATVVLSGGADLPVASAAESSVNFDEYTDSDVLLGGTKTVRDYANSLHHSTVSWNGATYTVRADDPIVQIVPKSLFATKGEHIHIGREYGFFVRTTADSYSNGSQSRTDKYNNNVEVLVFDITTDTNLKATTDRIIVKVQPLFQYRYAYIDYRSTQFFSDNNLAGGASFYLNYSIPTGTAYVVPKPVGKSADSFSQTWNYFLKDISVSATLLNEQALNDADEDYIASKDNGYFITGFDYKYDGFVSAVSKEDKISLGLNVASMFCGAVSFVPGVGTFAGVLGMLIGGGQTAASIAVVDNAGNPAVGTSVNNGQLTAVNKYSTKAAQAANYINELTKKPCLTKNATCFINGDDKHGNVWFRDGDGVTAVFKVSHTDDWLARLEREISLCVVDKQGNGHCEKAQSQYKYAVNEPVNYSLELDRSMPLVMLADGDNYFQIYTYYTSDYQFTFPANTSVEVFTKTSGSSAYTKAGLSGGKYTVRLEGGRTFHVRVHSAKKTLTSFTVSPAATMTSSVAPQAEYLLKLAPPATGAYTLSTSSSSFVIKSLFQNTTSNAYANIPRVDRAINKTTVDAVMKKGGVYYALLKNTSSSAATCSVSLSACSQTIKDGTNAARAFTGGENYRFYKYTVTAAKPSVTFAFDNDGVNNRIQFCVFDQGGNIVAPYSQFYDGYMELANLSAGVYYVGVRTTANATLKPTLKDGSDLGVWKRFENGKWTVIDHNEALHLPRGKSYQFGYWVETTLISSYAIDDALKEDGLNFDNDGINIARKRKDSCPFTLKAVKKCDDKDVNGMHYPFGLTIVPEFDVNEIAAPSFDYNNKMTATVVLVSQDIQKITYRILSNASNGSALSGLDEQTKSTLTAGKKFDVELLQMLCNRKATKAKLVIVGVEILSGVNDDTVRTVTLNKQYDINCMYSELQGDKSYISNELHLYNIRHNTSKNIFITCDITLNHFANWDIIDVNPEGTNINGQGKTIDGMRFTVPTGSNKLYGFIGENRGEVHRILFKNVSITGKTSDRYGEMRFGTVAALNYGKITHCKVSGIINVYRRDGVVGGICAINYSFANIEDCVFGYIGNRDQNYLGNSGDIGGIAGRNFGGSVLYCKVLNATIGGDVDHCAKSYGGVVGYMEAGAITVCDVTGVYIKVTNGTLISGHYPSMGFLVGHMNSGSMMSNCTLKNNEKNITKLTVGYRKNCFNGTGGCYGISKDCYVHTIIVS